MEEGADTLGPSGFVVFGAFDALVVEVLFELPALVDENVAEALDVFDGAAAFTGAGIEPDARVRKGRGGLGEAKNHALIPPDGRGKGGDTAEDLWEFEAEI